MSAGIVGVFLLTAVAWSRWAPQDVYTASRLLAQADVAAAERLLVAHLKQHTDDDRAWKLLIQIHFVASAPSAQAPSDPVAPSAPPVPRQTKPHLDTDSLKQLFDTSTGLPAAILRAWVVWFDQGWAQGLLALDPLLDSPVARLERAEMLSAAGQHEAALAAAEDALLARPDSERAATLVLVTLLRLGRTDALDARLREPRFARIAPTRLLFEMRRRRGETAPMLWQLMRLEWERMTWTVTLACAVVGLCWVVIALHLSSAWRWTVRQQALIPAALALGVASTFVTLAVVVLQDDYVRHAERQHTLAYNLAYCILGIGLREELIKLLFILPLLPALVRIKNDLAILTVCSMVGLGFAAQENIGYYAGTLGSAVLGRFLTANFLHMTLTGYVGYFLVNAWRRGGARWNDFYNAFGMVVVCHGVYDLLLIAPELAPYSWLAMTLYIWLSQQYLRLALQLRGDFRGRVSMTRVFVACLSVATGVNLVLVSAYYPGVWMAIKASYLGFIGTAVIAYMFFREFDEVID